jgi:hypothetical protein
MCLQLPLSAETSNPAVKSSTHNLPAHPAFFGGAYYYRQLNDYKVLCVLRADISTARALLFACRIDQPESVCRITTGIGTSATRHIAPCPCVIDKHCGRVNIGRGCGDVNAVICETAGNRRGRLTADDDPCRRKVAPHRFIFADVRKRVAHATHHISIAIPPYTQAVQVENEPATFLQYRAGTVQQSVQIPAG